MVVGVFDFVRAVGWYVPGVRACFVSKFEALDMIEEVVSVCLNG